jgi:dienelactone hydrolase
VTAKRLVAGLAALLLPVALAACGPAVAAQPPAQRATAAPQAAYPVGVRTLALRRGTARPLPTTVWYPAAGQTGASDGPVRDAPMATGRFPVILFSHGLRSLPENHAQLTARWAAAGFVVAAPAYPHTNLRAERFDRADVRHQPADAWQAIREIVRLDRTRGDPFAGRLDPTRLAAAGHSAGGFTTAGLFTAGHSRWLRGGIVIAGGMRHTFGGPSAALLFVHGGADPTVSAARGRAAYDQVPWPKAFLTLTGQGHGEYLTPGWPGFDQTIATTIDFLRWTLYGDEDARRRIPTDARLPGVSRLDGRF